MRYIGTPICDRALFHPARIGEAFYRQFFRVFSRLNKAYGLATAYIGYTEACMRHERILGEHVWYLVSTAVNIGETLFQLGWTEDLLCRVLCDAKGN
jgi:hypothetical protein